MNKQYRQGDVLLIRVAKVPAGEALAAEDDRVILAYGEATGHHHSLSARVATLFEHQQQRYLRMDLDGPLEHQEHAPILIPKGDYLVVRQREYSPEAIRNVAD